MLVQLADMTRRLFICGMVLLTLSGCAAPEPDPALTSIYKQTSDSLKEPVLAEITRLCGHFEDGSVPESCDPNKSPIPAANPGTAGIEEQLSQVPQESLPVVVEAYSQTYALTPTPERPSQLFDGIDFTSFIEDTGASATADKSAVASAIERELGVLYTIGTIRAFADNPTRDRLDDLEDQHEKVLAALTENLTTAANPPAIPAGYQIPSDILPADQPLTNNQDAIGAVEKLTETTEAFWRRTAETAQTTPWRIGSIRIATLLSTPNGQK